VFWGWVVCVLGLGVLGDGVCGSFLWGCVLFFFFLISLCFGVLWIGYLGMVIVGVFFFGICDWFLGVSILVWCFVGDLWICLGCFGFWC